MMGRDGFKCFLSRYENAIIFLFFLFFWFYLFLTSQTIAWYQEYFKTS